MELIQTPIKHTRKTLSVKEQRIIFIGDIQWAGQRQHMSAITHLKETLKRGMEQDALFIGMGDYIDFLSPSNRQRLTSAALYDTATDVIDDKAMDLTHELYQNVLKPTKGRWLGLVEGHHFHELKTGDTTDMRLCEMLDAPFLGSCGVIKLNFTGGRLGTQRIPVTLWVHHGHGNGQTGYYPLARLEKIHASHESVDVFAIGHTTKMGVLARNRMGFEWSKRGGEAYHRKVYLVGTGGYSRSYIEGARQGRVPRGGYAEKQMLDPAVIGSPTLIIRHVQSTSNIRVDLAVEV